jgi:hypothetical protein
VAFSWNGHKRWLAVRATAIFGSRSSNRSTRRTLKNNGVAFRVIDNALLIASAASHGLVLEFVEQETI